MYERKRWTVQVYKGHSFNMVCVSISLSLSFLSLSQSKEITFQLQEDLMKVLNELYTVSISPVSVYTTEQSVDMPGLEVYTREQSVDVPGLEVYTREQSVDMPGGLHHRAVCRHAWPGVYTREQSVDMSGRGVYTREQSVDPALLQAHLSRALQSLINS